MKHGLMILSALILVAAGLVFMSMNTKRPKLKGTAWQFEEKMFVADAGYETTTYTIEFVTSKDAVYKRKTYMPPHPNMYMNPDGTVSTNPGWGSEDEKKCTYKWRRNILSLTFEDGSRMVMVYRDGKLTDIKRSLSGEERVFTMVEGQ